MLFQAMFLDNHQKEEDKKDYTNVVRYTRTTANNYASIRLTGRFSELIAE